MEHLKIETRLIDEMFPSVMGEYDETIKRGVTIKLFLNVGTMKDWVCCNMNQEDESRHCKDKTYT